ncbi:phage portal protein [Micromonosporaceae bacterium B7E4]
MDLLSRIQARRRRGPERAWPVGKGELIAPDYAFGHDDSRFSPEEYGDYAVTSNDVYSVVALRARMLSGLTLRFYRGRGADKTEVTTHPAVDQYRKVNPFWTAKRLARMDEFSMGLWGETVWALEPGRRGQPGEIWWLKPSRVRPVPHETGYIQGYAYHSVSGEIIRFEPDEIVWFRYPNPLDEFSALSPLAAARLAADTSEAMTKSNNALFKQGLQIAGLIVPPADKVTFSQEQADDLERQLQRRMTGSDKAHRWAVLRYEAQFKQLQITPKDAEFTAGLNMSFRQVCRAYGIPSPLLNDLEHATLANAREFERIAWGNALVPDAEFRAQEIEEQYLPRFRGGPDHCAFDFTEVAALQESATESWTREAQALDRGAMTINEWRKSKGMPPVAWGDTPYMPVNKAPLGPDGQLQVPEKPAGNPPDDETNPVSQPPQMTGEKMLDHHAARRLLAEIRPINGVRL